MSSRVQPPPKWAQTLLAIYCVIVIGVDAWSWFAYMPPFRWFAEAQMAVGGAYSPLFAFLLVLFAGLAPVLLLTALFGRGKAQADSYPAVEQVAVFRQLRAPLIVATLGIVLAGMGAYNFIDAERIGSEQISLTLDSLADGETPGSRWVEIAGAHPHFEGAIGLTESGRRSDFIPLYSRSPNEEPVVIVEASSYERDELRHTPLVVDGVLRSTVAGEVRTELEERGMAAGSYWVLDLHDSPQRRRELGTFLTPTGLVVLLAGVVWIVARRRAQR